MDHNNCSHCSLLCPKNVNQNRSFWRPNRFITKQPPWVHYSYPENLSLPNSDRPTPDPIITGGRFWSVIFNRKRPEIWDLKTENVSCEKEQPHDVEKCMWSWHMLAILLDQPRLAKSPQFRCCSIPKMDSKDGYLHPKLIHTAMEFSLSIFWNCKPWWILDPCQKN